ncbi:MAG: permease [Candidatus Solibacter sp.]|nr:permease [Candidatus Solibacter sp.]
MYFPAVVRQAALLDVAVRTQGRPEDTLTGVRRKVHDLDPELAVSAARTMNPWVAGNAVQPRFQAALFAAFACVALLIAAVGIYGVLSYSSF